jgi:metallo-beta-lactamase class B
VKLIGGSHEHLDHVGGIAELQRLTGATVMATPAGFVAYETGVVAKEDPQFGLHKPFPGSKVGLMLSDGFVVRQGPLSLTAWATPGHAPGSTSWSWRSCEGKKCLNFVYADSISAVSSDTYKFSKHRRYVVTFRDSIRNIGRLRCDVLITPHPSASNLYDRLAGKAPLVDGNACKAYSERGLKGLSDRLAREQAK